MNGDEQIFHKWVKSDFNYNHNNEKVDTSLKQNLDDEQLEGSGFVFQWIVCVILEIYKVNDTQAT